MKKKLIVFVAIGIVLAVLGGVMIMLFNSNKPPNVGTFDLANYQREIETFTSDKDVGQVGDANTAIEKAKELWIEKFGVINGKPHDPTQGRRVNVSYDTENKCWLIQGTLPSNVDGSVPHALIQKDGKVLAIWYP